MDNTMNENYEITTEVSDSGEETQKIEEASTGPSKVFKIICAGGVATILGIIALRKHNKKKAKTQETVEEDDDFEVYDLDQEESETEDQVDSEEVEKTKKK